jgi:hypothetical protein
MIMPACGALASRFRVLHLRRALVTATSLPRHLRVPRKHKVAALSPRRGASWRAWPQAHLQQPARRLACAARLPDGAAGGGAGRSGRLAQRARRSRRRRRVGVVGSTMAPSVERIDGTRWEEVLRIAKQLPSVELQMHLDGSCAPACGARRGWRLQGCRRVRCE